MSSPEKEKHPSPANTKPATALGRLAPLFSEHSVSEVVAVLDRYGNDVKEAAWALLNGETADNEGEADTASQLLPMARHLRAADDQDGDDGGGAVDSLLLPMDRHLGAAGGEGGDDDPDGDADAEDPPRGDEDSAPSEIRRLYAAGAISHEEYREMIAADQKAAPFRDSRNPRQDEAKAMARQLAASLSREDDVASTEGTADAEAPRATAAASADNVGATTGSRRSALAEIRLLYDEGAITREERDAMARADQRAAPFRDSQQQPPQASPERPDKLQSLSAQLRKLDLASLIDQMEEEQERVDELEFVNNEIQQEMEMKQMVRDATRRSLELMQSHLAEFRQRHPGAAYEAWIAELHPENVTGGRPDHRFYAGESDHRRLWNEALGEEERAAVPRGYVASRAPSPPR